MFLYSSSPNDLLGTVTKLL